MKKELIKTASSDKTTRISSFATSPTTSFSVSFLPPSPTSNLTLSSYEKECLKNVKLISIIFADRPREELKVIGFANDLHSVFTRPKDVFIEAVIAAASSATSAFDGLPKEEKMIILSEAVLRILIFRTAFYFHFEWNSFSIRLVITLIFWFFIKCLLFLFRIHKKVAGLFWCL